ncbi:MAG: dihydrofolate reductase [Cryobacterium sp.]
MPSEADAATGTIDAGPAGTGVAMIWAQARGGVIGDADTIPWRLSEDQVRFKQLTAGAAVVMGRRTWTSLPARFRPLPGRRNIVITRSADWSEPGAEVASSPRAALALAGAAPLWIIGGGEIYRSFLPLADRLEVTEIDLEVPGDTVAPAVGADWATVAATEWRMSVTGIRYRFITYHRAAGLAP